jgi:hypothetical protein
MASPLDLTDSIDDMSRLVIEYCDQEDQESTLIVCGYTALVMSLFLWVLN